MQNRVKTKIPSSKLHAHLLHLIGLRHKKRLGETKEGQLQSYECAMLQMRGQPLLSEITYGSRRLQGSV